MMQTIEPRNKIVIHLDCYEGKEVENKYVAWLQGPEYGGIVVSAKTVGECIREIGISINALEIYRQNREKINP